MARTEPVAVVIPTYGRGTAVLQVLESVEACDPPPKEIWVHVDDGDGFVERGIRSQFPEVKILTSSYRRGPGGGRNECLQLCGTPYAVSLDDDSYPVDKDFFSQVTRLFGAHSDCAIFGAQIWHRYEAEKPKGQGVTPSANYIGCGHAIRLAAYRSVRGYLARPFSYGMEENDLSLQLFAAGWKIFEARQLRVFHDTDLKHHDRPEITAWTITNIALCAFLHYPVVGWPWGVAQVMNLVVCSIRKRRLRGIVKGVIQIPFECWKHRHLRKPLSWHEMRAFLLFRRTGVLKVT